MKIGFISLGCSKNLVVTEEIIGMFKKHNFKVVNDVLEAEIILINTCGFIESAKEEAIETILEMADYKKKNCKYLIVTGCLVKRYKTELQKELPEVDLFIAVDEYEQLWNQVDRLINKANGMDDLNYKYRELTTGASTAYLKIAEGCSNYCTYCAIPYIQGPYISRKYEEILDEANLLAKQGIRELIVIAQDTSKYGLDLYGKKRLAELLTDLTKIEGIKWVRFLYTYPEEIDNELITVVKNNAKICKYFDIPIQHIDDNILKRMNRKTMGNDIKNLINKLRKEIPDVIIRTTLIVGFPGEGEEAFNNLYDFVKTYKIDKLGAFAYSREDGTPAAKFPNQLQEKTKEIRRKEIMKLQQSISSAILKSKIGKKYKCLIENITDDGNYYIGRTYMDVPSEDGLVYVQYKDNVMLNEYYDIEIIDAKAYDLLARFIK